MTLLVSKQSSDGEDAALDHYIIIVIFLFRSYLTFSQQKKQVIMRDLPSSFLFLFLLFHPLTSEVFEEVDKVPVEVIHDSSPCSATCGLGVKTQTLCLMTDGEKAMEEGGNGETETEVSSECRVRKVKCLGSWQCGLRTMTVTSGQRVEIDCLGEVMEAMGRFSWRVLWRYARGIISSDDSLFARWKSPQLDRVILDPVREEDAGTYRCDVQDANFRRVKRVYWGIRVLPAGLLSLDYDNALAQWESTGNQQSQMGSDQTDQRMTLLYTVLIALSLAGAAAGLILGLCWMMRRKQLKNLDRCFSCFSFKEI